MDNAMPRRPTIEEECLELARQIAHAIRAKHPVKTWVDGLETGQTWLCGSPSCVYSTVRLQQETDRVHIIAVTGLMVWWRGKKIYSKDYVQLKLKLEFILKTDFAP